MFLDIQMKSHLRCTSYFIAMALGYVLTVYRPAKYRGVISRVSCLYVIIRSSGNVCLVEKSLVNGSSVEYDEYNYSNEVFMPGDVVLNPSLLISALFFQKFKGRICSVNR